MSVRTLRVICWKDKDTSTSSTASDTTFSDIYHKFSFVGTQGQYLSCAKLLQRQSYYQHLGTMDKHQNTGGKSLELPWLDGIIPFPLVPISNTSRERGEEEQKGGCHSYDCCNYELCPQGLLIWHFAQTQYHSISPALYKRQSSLAVQLRMVLTNISDSRPAYDRQRSCLQH